MGVTTAGKRLIVKGGIYHVIQRAPGKEYVFVEDNDYLYFLKLLKETAQDFKIKIYCFALLPNHLHLLLEIEEENLSLAMQNLFRLYATYFNKKYERKGHVFSGRFRAPFCNDETYLLTASAYIHVNPLKANLCQNFRDYRWSSVHLYIDRPKESFVRPAKILSLLNNDQMLASRMYEEMLLFYAATKGKVLIDHRSFNRAIRVGIGFLKDVPLPGREDNLESLMSQLKSGKRLMTAESQNGRKYIVTQLLARGYEHQEIQDQLKISPATLYRIIQSNE
ncbi:MAG: transposase [Candidatus Omnitrophota bacterium]